MASQPLSSSSCDLSHLLMDIILVEILPRLPVKSLMRFKCVSKTFKDFISSPEFTQLQLNYALSPKGKRLLVLCESCDRIFTYDLDAPVSPTIATFSRSYLGLDDCTACDLQGSCNGVLCFYCYHDYDRFNNYLLFLNPTTHLSLRTPFAFGDAEPASYCFGLGFDHISLDYKIVAIYLEKKINSCITMVYSLNLSSWKVVESRDLIKTYEPCALVEGHLLHWMFESQSISECGICCFDVCREKWRDDVLLPAFYCDPSLNNYFLLEIGVLDGNLCSLFEDRAHSEFVAEVWVLKEYGVQKSWFRLVKIPLSGNLGNGFWFIARRRWSTQVLLNDKHRSKLFWYNTEDDEICEARFELPPDLSIFPFAGSNTCIESLVSLAGSKLL